MGLFTVEEARTELDALLPVLDAVVALRAEAAELAAAQAPGGRATGLGGMAELKAAQARLDELMTQVQQTGAVSGMPSRPSIAPTSWSASAGSSPLPTVRKSASICPRRTPSTSFRRSA
jgi:hypothetical protein